MSLLMKFSEMSTDEWRAYKPMFSALRQVAPKKDPRNILNNAAFRGGKKDLLVATCGRVAMAYTLPDFVAEIMDDSSCDSLRLPDKVYKAQPLSADVAQLVAIEGVAPDIDFFAERTPPFSTHRTCVSLEVLRTLVEAMIAANVEYTSIYSHNTNHTLLENDSVSSNNVDRVIYLVPEKMKDDDTIAPMFGCMKSSNFVKPDPRHTPMPEDPATEDNDNL